MAVEMLAKFLGSQTARRQLLLLDAQQRVYTQWLLTDPFDTRQVELFVESAADVSVSAQRRMVSLANATQRRYLAEMDTDLGDFVAEVPDEVRMYSQTRSYRHAKPKVVRTKQGVAERLPTPEVFYRPVREYRRLVQAGRDVDDALDTVASRVKMEIATNVQLAEREAESQVIRQAGVVDLDVTGWRRVIRPERSRTGTCGLCVAASDRVYSTDELKPIHSGCQCAVMPIKEGADGDPGLRLNREDLNRLYDDAGGTAAKQLLRTKYRVDEHGELQAVLVPQKRGEAVPRYRDSTTSPMVDLDSSDKAIATRHLPGMRRSLANLLKSGASETDPRVLWQQSQILRFERML
ncbi:hypothetical protein ACIGO9_28770 [Nocardia asteroides]|uniref:hypothetical protein n=1 Tax=Nocardia asteroides TaxID=1824 RepID=UPI0037C55398